MIFFERWTYTPGNRAATMKRNADKTLAYNYDVLDRRTGETRSSTPARTFGYDLTSQLTAVNQSGGNATFAYDAVGNRTIVTGAPGAGGYTANNLNQYTVAGDVGALGYDANGNLATAGGWTYTHDGNSRLVAASGPGSVTATFGRDGRNRDVKRTINGTTTYLIYDGWNLVAEYDAAGTLTTQYVHGPQTDEILAKVTPSSTTFPLPDALGSTIAVTDASGAVLERVFYSDAFGTPTFKDANGTPLAGTTTATRFLFTGREWMAELNFYDYRNRAYSAELGRFLQTDPIAFEAGDVNLYRYVANNPVNWLDPLGLAPGDSYATVDDAAKDAMEDIHKRSVSSDREYGGALYKKPDGSFSYTEPHRGDSHSVGIRAGCPKFEGYYHSHGAESGPKYNDEQFSKTDKQIAINTGKPAYVVTPSGAMKKYNPAKRGFLKNPISRMGNANE